MRRNANKKLIRLTESDLCEIIKSSVRKCLYESRFNSDLDSDEVYGDRADREQRQTMKDRLNMSDWEDKNRRIRQKYPGKSQEWYDSMLGVFEDKKPSNILAENEIEEGMFGGLNNVWQGMKSGNFNVGQTYRASNISSNFQKYAQQAMLAIQQLSNIAKQTNNKQIVQYLNNVYSALEKTIPMFQKTAQNIAQGNGQQGTAKDFSINQKNMQRLGYNNMLNKNQMKQYNQMVANGEEQK